MTHQRLLRQRQSDACENRGTARDLPTATIPKARTLRSKRPAKLERAVGALIVSAVMTGLSFPAAAQDRGMRSGCPKAVDFPRA